MIHVDRCPPPQILAGPTSAGRRERKASIEYYRKVANKRGKFPFKAYKNKEVADALRSMFGGKCAYCEGIYDQFHPTDIEHYRPKSGYANGKKLEVPGYYWLAADWNNLLPSCIDCNRARYQEFADAPAHVSGKANKFPLADEGKRARGPGRERHERPLLLDPCRDDPEKHLVFDEVGHVDPARDRRGRLSPMGVASIEVYGLDRDAKVRARQRVMKFLSVSMRHIEDLMVLLDRHPDDAGIEQCLREEYLHMREFMAPSSEFALMCRQAIERFEQGLFE
jgi:uncharacterized protein (TIGR02646 family)